MKNQAKHLAAIVALCAGGCAGLQVKSVPASWETASGAPVSDAAIWIDPTDAAHSLIIAAGATGLVTYGIDGAERQRFPSSRLVSVDLRDDLVVAASAEPNTLHWFRADRQTRRLHVAGETVLEGQPLRGLCAGKIGGVFHVAIAYTDGVVETWAARDAEDGSMALNIARATSFETPTNACVFDEDNKRIFVSEEQEGVWSTDSVDTDGPATGSKQVDSVATGNGLVADVKGISLWRGADANGFLVVSAQGGDRFVVYDRAPPHTRRGVIRITSGRSRQSDAVSGTDGVEASSSALPQFSNGFLVVQDEKDGAGLSQNFKLVNWSDVEKALRLRK